MPPTREYGVFFSGELSIYIPWPFPTVWGVADNTKETTKTMGVLLRSSSGETPCDIFLIDCNSPSGFHLTKHGYTNDQVCSHINLHFTSQSDDTAAISLTLNELQFTFSRGLLFLSLLLIKFLKNPTEFSLSFGNVLE